MIGSVAYYWIFVQMAHRRAGPPGHPHHYTYLGRQIPFSTDESRTRFREWGYLREVAPPMVIDVGALETYGLWESIHALLGDSHWRTLLFFEGPTSPGLTIEFLCSLRFWNGQRLEPKTGRIGPDTRMVFTLRGEEHSLTVREMAIRLQLYSEEFAQSVAFD